jgi:hypothetical protein
MEYFLDESKDFKCDDTDCMCCNYAPPTVDDYNFFYLILKDENYHEITKEDYIKLSDWDFKDFPTIIKTKNNSEIILNNKTEFHLLMSTNEEDDYSLEYVIDRVKSYQPQVVDENLVERIKSVILDVKVDIDNKLSSEDD